jgi:hypothetical protein
MPIAQVGLFTTIIEETATAMCAGIVLASVGMGLLGMALGWSRQILGERALTDGYVGGLFGVGLAAVDVLLRYVL